MSSSIAPSLRQMLRNVFANAYSYNVDGGWVHASTRPAFDHATGRRSALISIRNSGPVVHEVDRLIEPFYRARARVQPKDGPQGHGLGLSIVRAIVDAHDGQLQLTAIDSGGLQVDVLLPHTVQPRF